MKYEELKQVVSLAWKEFYGVLEDNGIDRINKLHTLIDSKDSFNDVFDCIMEVADLECEE